MAGLVALACCSATISPPSISEARISSRSRRDRNCERRVTSLRDSRRPSRMMASSRLWFASVVLSETRCSASRSSVPMQCSTSCAAQVTSLACVTGFAGSRLTAAIMASFAVFSAYRPNRAVA